MQLLPYTALVGALLSSGSRVMRAELKVTYRMQDVIVRIRSSNLSGNRVFASTKHFAIKKCQAVSGVAQELIGR